MKRDFYAFRQAELNSTLSELEQAAAALDEARDRDARQEAESQMAQAARKAVTIDPHAETIDPHAETIDPHLPYL